MSNPNSIPKRDRIRPASLLAAFLHRGYFTSLFRLAFPIMLQGLVTASLNMVAVVLVGQKGDVAVAAVGLAGQLFFLQNLVVFGIASGSAIFIAQLWGKRDIGNVHRVLGLTLALSLLATLLFFILAVGFPVQVLSLYSTDPAVIALGAQYLHIYGFAFFFFAITVTYSTVLRSIGNVRLPMFVSGAALVFNTLLTYALIFGRFGLPAMGVTGAALSAVIARGLECTALLVLSYRQRSPIAASIKELLGFDLAFIGRVLKPVLPVMLNELLWSLGVTTYFALYAHINTESVAAVNILSTIENFTFAVMNGISLATAVLVGHHIGAGGEHKAYRDAGRSLALSGLSGLLLGVLAFLLGDWILGFYKVTPAVISNTKHLLTIFSLLLWLRAMNVTLVLGVLRAGGDTRYALVLDGFIIWLVGVPLVALGIYALHLPVYWVYLLAMSEELTKWVLGLGRYFSRRWIHNLALDVQEDQENQVLPA
jgi:putative MATE family efflux protein